MHVRAFLLEMSTNGLLKVLYPLSTSFVLLLLFWVFCFVLWNPCCSSLQFSGWRCRMIVHSRFTNLINPVFLWMTICSISVLCNGHCPSELSGYLLFFLLLFVQTFSKYIHNKDRHYTTAQTKTLFVHTFSIQTYEMCPLVSMQ